jgi:hypothetical protein
MEGSRRDIIEVLSWHLPAVTELYQCNENYVINHSIILVPIK